MSVRRASGVSLDAWKEGKVGGAPLLNLARAEFALLPDEEPVPEEVVELGDELDLLQRFFRLVPDANPFHFYTAGVEIGDDVTSVAVVVARLK